MAKTFTRIGKDIAMSVRDGGPNPETNSRLRAVIQNAKAANMPKDNIERAIKRASDKSTENYKEVLFDAAFMGEQPNPWDVLPPQDATSRHRGAKPPRRYELLGEISLLSLE